MDNALANSSNTDDTSSNSNQELEFEASESQLNKEDDERNEAEGEENVGHNQASAISLCEYIRESNNFLVESTTKDTEAVTSLPINMIAAI